MRLKISEKNSKIGKIPNLSLTPGASCVPRIKCFSDGCYAKNAYNRYPATKNAWDSNLRFYQDDSRKFFDEFWQWLYKYKPERFRLFVGGDFPNEEFYWSFENLCEEYLATKFLVFTKRFDYDYSLKPSNLEVILSTWPGVPLPTNTDLPWSWIEDDPRKPETYFRCPGGCTDCRWHCWDKIDKDTHVIFPKH